MCWIFHKIRTKITWNQIKTLCWGDVNARIYTVSLKPTETWITRARIHARRDIGKEGAHLVPSSVHQHLNLRLACEVFAFGTLVRRLKKGQHCSRDGVFYSNQKTERAATGDFSHTLRPLLPIARLLSSQYTQPQIRCWTWKSDALWALWGWDLWGSRKTKNLTKSH